MLNEMIPVLEILEHYPEGTQLNLWFKYACGGAAPQYAGLFVVEGKSLRAAGSGLMWGVDAVSGIDRRRPVYIVRVEQRGKGEGAPAETMPYYPGTA